LGRELRGGNVNSVQYKSNQNCYYESPLYNEYILTKIYLKKNYISRDNVLFGGKNMVADKTGSYISTVAVEGNMTPVIFCN
jgi:hypothetical protein